jgi:hypothetical protein
MSLSLFSSLTKSPPLSLKRKNTMEVYKGGREARRGSTQRKYTEGRKNIEGREVE